MENNYCIPWRTVDSLPEGETMDRCGAHGSIVRLDNGNIIKVFKKKDLGEVPYVFLMEILTRQCCGNDYATNKILPIVCVQETDDEYGIEMPYLDNGDLWEILHKMTLENQPSLSPTVLIAIVTDLLIALDCLHSNGIAHRDVKDANILIKSDLSGGLLCDMSLATFVPHIRGEPFIPYTKRYRAPELLNYSRTHRGHMDWLKTDIYAAGLVIAKMVLIANGTWKTEDPPSRQAFKMLFASEGLIKTTICDMLSKNPRKRPSAREALSRIVQPAEMHPPFPIRSALPSTPIKGILDIANELKFPPEVGSVACDIYTSLPSNVRGMARLYSMYKMCVALAAKACTAVSETCVTGEMPHTVSLLDKFIGDALRSPDVLRACYRSTRL